MQLKLNLWGSGNSDRCLYFMRVCICRLKFQNTWFAVNFHVWFPLFSTLFFFFLPNTCFEPMEHWTLLHHRDGITKKRSDGLLCDNRNMMAENFPESAIKSHARCLASMQKPTNFGKCFSWAGPNVFLFVPCDDNSQCHFRLRTTEKSFQRFCRVWVNFVILMTSKKCGRFYVAIVSLSLDFCLGLTSTLFEGFKVTHSGVDTENEKPFGWAIRQNIFFDVGGKRKFYVAFYVQTVVKNPVSFAGFDGDYSFILMFSRHDSCDNWIVIV